MEQKRKVLFQSFELLFLVFTGTNGRFLICSYASVKADE